MQPHSGGKDEELLFTCSTVVVLNADSDSDVAPLVIAADHNTYIGPDAILVHAGIDLRIDIPRNLSQHHIQQRILVVIPGGDHNRQIIPYLLLVDTECPSIAKDVELTVEILVQLSFSHCTKLCIIGHLDALLAADLVQHFLLLRVVDGPTAATGGKHQQSHSTCQ